MTIPSYVALADNEIDPDSGVTTSLMTRMRDNPLAIAGADAAAPRIYMGYTGLYAFLTDVVDTTKVLRPDGAGNAVWGNDNSINPPHIFQYGMNISGNGIIGSSAVGTTRESYGITYSAGQFTITLDGVYCITTQLSVWTSTGAGVETLKINGSAVPGYAMPQIGVGSLTLRLTAGDIITMEVSSFSGSGTITGMLTMTKF